MKKLNSEKMRKLLKVALRNARREKRPSPGMIRSVLYRTEKNGWHYQGELSSDGGVVVYAFKPPLRMNARSADYFL